LDGGAVTRAELAEALASTPADCPTIPEDDANGELIPPEPALGEPPACEDMPPSPPPGRTGVAFFTLGKAEKELSTNESKALDKLAKSPRLRKFSLALAVS